MRKNILIVDDSAAVRKSVRAILQGSSELVVSGEAVDGRDAVVKARELKPDLIVLDLSMPVMNGLEAARELKRLDPNIPLLMFTTFKNAQVEKEAIASGCAAVISKTESRQLLVGIRDLLGTSS